VVSQGSQADTITTVADNATSQPGRITAPMVRADGTGRPRC